MNAPLNQDFVGKTVLITGAGSGIGLATARGLSARGASIAAIDHSAERLQEFETEFETKGSYITFLADVADSELAQEIVQAVIAKFGKLDALVLSAGINGPVGHIESILPSEVRKVLEINILGLYNYLIPTVGELEKTRGSIALIGSINGSRTFSWAGASAYIASKAAVVALGRSLAVELGPRGIRVNTICPGSVNTNINETTKWRGDTPVGRPKKYPEGSMPLTGWEGAEPEDVATAIAFLASDAAKHITGTELFVDAGQSLS